MTKKLRSAGEEGYGDFTDHGTYGSSFASWTDVMNSNDNFGIISSSDEETLNMGSMQNNLTITFTQDNIPLNQNKLYYVYLWTYYQGHYYPDNLMMVISVNNGVVQYTPSTYNGSSITDRNAYDNSTFQNVVIENADSFNVNVQAGQNMTKVSGDEAQTNITTAMTSVVYTADDGYYFPDTYAVTPVNGINVSRDSETQITVYGRPTANTAITLTAPTRIPSTLENTVFSYAYDAQRDPVFPGINDNINMSSLAGPLNSDGTHMSSNEGTWKLSPIGIYLLNSNLSTTANNYLASIVNTVADKYSVDPNNIVIYELKNGTNHIAYGVVLSYDSLNDTAVFIGDLWSDSGACYLLSASKQSDSVTLSAGKIATDYTKSADIKLDVTGTYVFPDAVTGYSDLSARIVEISKAGDVDFSALNITLSGTNADSFILDKSGIDNIAVGENAQFSVSPKTGLSAGTHTATVTVSGQNIDPKSFDVSFTVAEASQPARPSRPYRDNVTVDPGNAKTDADLSKTTVTADGVTTSTVDTVTAGKIVDKSVANKSTSIDIKATSGLDATKTSNVIIPTATIKSISEKTDASMNIKCDIASIEFSKEAIDSMASQATGDTVQIIVEKVSESQHEVNFELKVVCSDGTVISDYKGGSVSVTVSLPSSMADKKLVCVYIDDEGIYHKVDGALNADGTYTFVTDHFSTYAIMAEEEADAVIAKQTAAAQKAAIKKVKATVALSTKNVKKGIRVTVKVPVDQKADKTGIILYRSMKKDSGYAMYKKVETKSSTYIITNTKNVKGNRLTAGKRYYYKARAYKVIDGKTYYGPMSTVKYMKAK